MMPLLIGGCSIHFVMISITFGIYLMTMSQKKEKEDTTIANIVAKCLFPTFERDSLRCIQFVPVATLCAGVKFPTSDVRTQPLVSESGECAMSHLVDFLLSASSSILRQARPPHVDVVILKNDEFLTSPLICRLI
jgi:hypothetical protein